MASIESHLLVMKDMYEEEIISPAGNPANLIRTGRIIDELHEYIKEELVEEGIPAARIFPALGSSSPEESVEGFFKNKKQDVLVKDSLGDPGISINVRSQLSSIQKNYDTLYERLVAEAVNLHEKSQNLTLGYLYLLPLFGYNVEQMQINRVVRDEMFNWEKYLNTFRLLAERTGPRDKSFKYEKLCLLAVDFSTSPPRVLYDSGEFHTAGLVSSSFAARFDYIPLNLDGFVHDLIRIYKARGGS